MSDTLILGTDTNAGKTTLAMLWLAAFADDYEYWKPVETGESDSNRIGDLVPGAAFIPPWLGSPSPSRRCWPRGWKGIWSHRSMRSLRRSPLWTEARIS